MELFLFYFRLAASATKRDIISGGPAFPARRREADGGRGQQVTYHFRCRRHTISSYRERCSVPKLPDQ